ncbi:MAG: ATP-binding protein [Myxococcales bacterium]
MSAITLHEVKHPNDAAADRYERLIGIDEQKGLLVEYLTHILDPDYLKRWQRKHHPRGLSIAKRIEDRPPLLILAGEVGCGKTALATSVGSPVAKALDKRVVVLETPSDVRGGGLVGQLSERVTAAFNEARVRIGAHPGILIIDEGDDLGTSRAQMQAHHEDRAGVNVLIKEIDRIARERLPLAVLMITNRFDALDPALVRRASVVRFVRPDAEARRKLFAHLLDGVQHLARDIDGLVRASEKNPPFTYSDIVERAAEAALLASVRQDRPFCVAMLREAIEGLAPSPMLDDAVR